MMNRRGIVVAPVNPQIAGIAVIKLSAKYLFWRKVEPSLVTVDSYHHAAAKLSDARGYKSVRPVSFGSMDQLKKITSMLAIPSQHRDEGS